jgi:hypothetical protein
LNWKDSITGKMTLKIARCEQKRENKLTPIKTNSILIKETADSQINPGIMMKIKSQGFQPDNPT